MLHAVLNGKRYGTGVARDGTLDTDNAGGAEDVITAVFFSRLAYLPDEQVQQFFRILLPDIMLSDGIDEIEFWPSWTLNGRGVEPDVVIISGDTLLLIEAKRHDNVAMQSPAQLARELVASSDAGLSFSRIILLCIGGVTAGSEALLRNGIEQQLQHYPQRDKALTDDFDFYCLHWKLLYQALNTALSDEQGNIPLHFARLVNDLYQALDWHGIPLVEFTGLAPQSPVRLTCSAIPQLFAQTQKTVPPDLLQGLRPATVADRPLAHTIPQFFTEAP